MRTDAGEAPIPAGSAPADMARLQNAHVHAALRQFKGGGEAGKPRPDHCHIAGLLADERRRCDGQGIGGGLPIAVNGAREMEGMRMGGGSHDAPLLASGSNKIKRVET